MSAQISSRADRDDDDDDDDDKFSNEEVFVKEAFRVKTAAVELLGRLSSWEAPVEICFRLTPREDAAAAVPTLFFALLLSSSEFWPRFDFDEAVGAERSLSTEKKSLTPHDPIIFIEALCHAYGYLCTNMTPVTRYKKVTGPDHGLKSQISRGRSLITKLSSK